MKTTYTTARRNAADFRQYLAFRMASALRRGTWTRDYYHIEHCIRELALLSGLSQDEVRENLELDVAIVEALAA